MREKVIAALRLDPVNGQDRISGMLAYSEGESDRSMQPYTARIQEIFSLGAGGNPSLPPKLRVSSACLDKATIVLNILGNGLGIKRKRNHVVREDDCIKDLYMVGLAANDPRILCTMGQHFDFSQSPEMLSWLRHPSFVDLRSGSEQAFPLPCMLPQLTQRIRLDQSSENRWIQLDVFALGSPRPPQEFFRDMAKRLIAKCLSLGMGRHPFEFQGHGKDLAAEFVGKTDFASQFMSYTIDSISSWGTWGTGPEYQYWYGQTFFGLCREQFTWTVACILECGLVWILGTGWRCGFPVTRQVAQQFEAVFPEGKWDLSYLDSMSWALHESGRQAVGAIMSLANWAVEWGNNRPNGRNAEYMPMLFAHGSLGLGHVMIFTRGDALLQVVMPCPLLENHYGRLCRIWLLQAKDDPFYKKMYGGEVPEWFLRAKAILFTDVKAKDTEVSPGSAADGKPGWRFREQVKIHGPPRFVDDEIPKQAEDPDEPDWGWPTKQKFQPSEKSKGEFCLPREDDDSITPQTEAEKGREAAKSTTSAGQSKELAWGLTWKKDKKEKEDTECIPLRR